VFSTTGLLAEGGYRVLSEMHSRRVHRAAFALRVWNISPERSRGLRISARGSSQIGPSALLPTPLIAGLHEWADRSRSA